MLKYNRHTGNHFVIPIIKGNVTVTTYKQHSSSKRYISITGLSPFDAVNILSKNQLEYYIGDSSIVDSYTFTTL